MSRSSGCPAFAAGDDLHAATAERIEGRGSWNTRTGSSTLSTVTVVVSAMPWVDLAMPAWTTTGNETANWQVWYSPTPYTSGLCRPATTPQQMMSSVRLAAVSGLPG